MVYYQKEMQKNHENINDLHEKCKEIQTDFAKQVKYNEQLYELLQSYNIDTSVIGKKALVGQTIMDIVSNSTVRKSLLAFIPLVLLFFLYLLC